jgi:hypothetical protein
MYSGILFSQNLEFLKSHENRKGNILQEEWDQREDEGVQETATGG